MVKGQNCNDCMHEPVCSKKEAYIMCCSQIKTEIGSTVQDLVSVDIKCNHFHNKPVNVRGDL